MGIVTFTLLSNESFLNEQKARLSVAIAARLCLGLSHLREHKFRHSFRGTLNQFCDCGCEIKATAPFCLHCYQFSTERITFLKKIKSIDTSMLNQSDSNLTKTFLFGGLRKHITINKLIINATTDLLLDTIRFDVPLF